VTYGFEFRATDVLGAPISGGTATGGTFTFDREAAAQACNPVSGSGCPVIDVSVTTAIPLVAIATSVSYDGGGGLAASDADPWSGVPGGVNQSFLAYSFTEITASRVSTFGGEANLFTLTQLAAGTYDIGTVIWDTSAASAGSHAVANLILPGLDGTGVNAPPVNPRNVVGITGTEVLQSGAIVITGAPVVPALSAVGLGILVVALVLGASRRSRARSS